ncbi:MAG: hypothetical protein ACE5NP_05580 [Anaerolineae bacterium]
MVIILTVVLLVVGVLTGWLVPKIFKSEPPYGPGVDIGACVVSTVGLGLIEWLWILPMLGFKGWIKLGAAIGDPWGLALIVLWLLRKVKS